MLKRLISFTITITFIFTQCGLGSAALFYEKAQNLRAKAVGDDKQDVRVSGISVELGEHAIIAGASGVVVKKPSVENPKQTAEFTSALREGRHNEAVDMLSEWFQNDAGAFNRALDIIWSIIKEEKWEFTDRGWGDGEQWGIRRDFDNDNNTIRHFIASPAFGKLPQPIQTVVTNEYYQKPYLREPVAGEPARAAGAEQGAVRPIYEKYESYVSEAKNRRDPVEKIEDILKANHYLMASLKAGEINKEKYEKEKKYLRSWLGAIFKDTDNKRVTGYISRIIYCFDEGYTFYLSIDFPYIPDKREQMPMGGLSGMKVFDSFDIAKGRSAHAAGTNVKHILVCPDFIRGETARLKLIEQGGINSDDALLTTSVEKAKALAQEFALLGVRSRIYKVDMSGELKLAEEVQGLFDASAAGAQANSLGTQKPQFEPTKDGLLKVTIGSRSWLVGPRRDVYISETLELAEPQDIPENMLSYEEVQRFLNNALVAQARFVLGAPRISFVEDVARLLEEEGIRIANRTDRSELWRHLDEFNSREIIKQINEGAVGFAAGLSALIITDSAAAGVGEEITVMLDGKVEEINYVVISVGSIEEMDRVARAAGKADRIFVCLANSNASGVLSVLGAMGVAYANVTGMQGEELRIAVVGSL